MPQNLEAILVANPPASDDDEMETQLWAIYSSHKRLPFSEYKD